MDVLVLNLATALVVVSGWSLALWKLYRGLEEARVVQPGAISRADAALLVDQEPAREAVLSGQSSA